MAMINIGNFSEFNKKYWRSIIDDFMMTNGQDTKKSPIIKFRNIGGRIGMEMSEKLKIDGIPERRVWLEMFSPSRSSGLPWVIEMFISCLTIDEEGTCEHQAAQELWDYILQNVQKMPMSKLSVSGPGRGPRM
jgi:hypothetical protein